MSGYCFRDGNTVRPSTAGPRCGREARLAYNFVRRSADAHPAPSGWDVHPLPLGTNLDTCGYIEYRRRQGSLRSDE
jgi:hypothetical protein